MIFIFFCEVHSCFENIKFSFLTYFKKGGFLLICAFSCMYIVIKQPITDEYWCFFVWLVMFQIRQKKWNSGTASDFIRDFWVWFHLKEYTKIILVLYNKNTYLLNLEIERHWRNKLNTALCLPPRMSEWKKYTFPFMGIKPTTIL